MTPARRAINSVSEKQAGMWKIRKAVPCRKLNNNYMLYAIKIIKITKYRGRFK